MKDAYGTTAADADGPASLQLAKVARVDPVHFTVDVETIYTHKLLTDVPFASPYTHRDHAGGIYVMPEEGSHCYVANTAEGTRFVVCFVLNPHVNPLAAIIDGENALDTDESEQDDDAPNFRGNRDFLEPGDIYLGTSDGNRIILRKGGMVEIGSTGMSQRMYFPVENLVRDTFQRYEAISPMGNVRWGYATVPAGELQIGDDTAEQTPVLIGYDIKGFAQDDETSRRYVVELRAGHLTADTLDPTIDGEHLFGQLASNPEKSEDFNQKQDGTLSFTVYKPDADGVADKAAMDAGAVTYTFQVSKTGNMFLLASGHIHIETEKRSYLRTPGVLVDYGSDRDRYFELLEDGAMEALVERVVMKVLKDFVVNTDENILLNAVKQVLLGDGADDGVTRGGALEKFMMKDMRLASSFGPVGPMLTPFTPGVVSETVKAKR